MSDHLLVESEGGIVRLTLNRPERRNALSLDLLRSLEGAIEAVAADPAARVVVLGSRGPVFCSGHDLSEMVGRTEAEYRELFAAAGFQLSRIVPTSTEVSVIEGLPV